VHHTTNEIRRVFTSLANTENPTWSETCIYQPGEYGVSIMFSIVTVECYSTVKPGDIR